MGQWEHLCFVFFGSSLIAGVILSPHCSDGMWEVLADQESYFTCTAEGPIYWTLRSNDNSAITIAECNQHCTLHNTYDGLFSSNTIDLHKRTIIINTKNNRWVYDNVQLVNSSLECSRRDQDTAFAACGLNFVYPPHGVFCTALNVSWSINVSCVIDSVYSSRNIYTCSLIRTQTLKNETQETVTMVTSPTSERISKKEAKMSGSCQFNTRLPSEEGQYGFLVSVSPGGQTFRTEDKQFTVARPKSPRISCGPQPHVLENTIVTCTCSTPSLGQPAGYLRWVIGNKTIQRKAAWQEKQELTSKELLYSHVLTLSDHGSTWFRCDLIWGTEEIGGKNYTASVGYAPKKPRFSLNGPDGNRTVKEKDQVNFLCESEGRPTPNVSIYNNDNDTVIIRASSPVNYTFIARCEDTATYTCSARNEFSSQSGVTTSYSLNMDVNCKPRSLSSTPLKMVKFRNEIQAKQLMFEVIAYPVPHKYDVWFVPLVVNNSELYSEKIEGSELNVTCKASGKHRYLSSCTLTVLSVLSRSDGVYRVQLTNEHGEENFTLEISYAAHEDFNPVVIYVVVSLVVFIVAIVVLIALIRKVKKNKGGEPSQDPEVIYETPWDKVPLTMQPLKVNVAAGSPLPERCQTPLYAVVNKTRKKTNPRSVETRRISAQDTHSSNSELQHDKDTEYAILDKFRGRTPATRGEDHKDKKSSSRAMRGLVADGSDVSTYDHLVMQPLPARQNDSAKWKMPYSASHSLTVDGGRWANDDGLIYVTPVFDMTNDARHRPAPIHEKTEYCTPREIGKFKFS